MKRYRIVQIGKKQPKYKIQKRGLFWIWKDMYLNIAHIKDVAPNITTTQIDVVKYMFDKIYDAIYVLNNYNSILYKSKTIYPCIKETERHTFQILYFRCRETDSPQSLDIIKSMIDRDINFKIEQEELRKENKKLERENKKLERENKKDIKYRKIVYIK